MDADTRRKQWTEQGFFILRSAISAAEAKTIEEEVIARIRSDPPEAHPGEVIYNVGPDYAIFPEKRPSPMARHPEDRVAKVFNCHVEGHARAVATSTAIVDRVEEILGPDLDCFQSQFIFKNPGVIGQPWHQDSYYFRFDTQPQVGVWLALSRATLETAACGYSRARTAARSTRMSRIGAPLPTAPTWRSSIRTIPLASRCSCSPATCSSSTAT